MRSADDTRPETVISPRTFVFRTSAHSRPTDVHGQNILAAMQTGTTSRTCIPDLRLLARVVNEESDRLCAIIDSARSVEVREQALLELKQLARNVRVCIDAIQKPRTEFAKAA